MQNAQFLGCRQRAIELANSVADADELLGMDVGSKVVRVSVVDTDLREGADGG